MYEEIIMKFYHSVNCLRAFTCLSMLKLKKVKTWKALLILSLGLVLQFHTRRKAIIERLQTAMCWMSERKYSSLNRSSIIKHVLSGTVSN